MELIDIHCHLMPYVDDGAVDLLESNELLQIQADQGVRDICVTPHLRGRMFHSTDEAVLEGYRHMQAEIREAGLPIRLHLSREYYFDEEFERRLGRDQLIPMGPGGVILTEFSYGTASSLLLDAADEILRAGYKPLFAHVERYAAVQQEPDLIRRLAEMGTLIQVNAASILRKEGWRQWFTARHLLNAGLVHVIASDAHNLQRRAPNLAQCALQIEKKYGQEEARRLFYSNSHMILYGTQADE